MKHVKNRSKFHEKMAVLCHYLAMNGKLWVRKKFSTHIQWQRWPDKSLMEIGCLEVPQPSYPLYFDQLSERCQPLSILIIWTPLNTSRCCYWGQVWSGKVGAWCRSGWLLWAPGRAKKYWAIQYVSVVVESSCCKDGVACVRSARRWPVVGSEALAGVR